ncbi:hypothetical protein EWE75_19495 [Sphingomonas populi]|uniref:Uncharacterized protein n=1 Tax=Sphingomonas populi TaxID=2484750 RepID=A0A4Q6XX87_9SPHN|nr:hypothetical protein [Sphingomonas populi]RZF61106.1 hypothetical protein EWE75_19495 [Sphingomonas populi]
MVRCSTGGQKTADSVSLSGALNRPAGTYVADLQSANDSSVSTGDRASIGMDPQPFIELDEEPPIGFDMTHRVIDGAVVSIT